jgi:hypothetical protein
VFESQKTYDNRYGDQYTWTKINENTYRFDMNGDSMKYSRFGGKEGQTEVDMSDLGMFDPSGGPYVTVGMKIDDQSISRIYTYEENIFVECSGDSNE